MLQIVKPEAGSGGEGVYKVTDVSDPHIRYVDYSPTSLQEFVEGQDECMSAFCSEGSIEASVAYRVCGGSVEFFGAPDLRELVEVVVKRVEYLTECNPRFWFNT